MSTRVFGEAELFRIFIEQECTKFIKTGLENESPCGRAVFNFGNQIISSQIPYARRAAKILITKISIVMVFECGLHAGVGLQCKVQFYLVD